MVFTTTEKTMTMPPAVSTRGRPAAPSNHVDGEDGAREDEDVADGRGGVKFGTAIAFDDAYGGDESGFVSSLPTLEEERRLLDEDDIRSRERMELEDEGRLTASHPSSRMQANGSKQVRFLPFYRVVFRYYDDGFIVCSQ
jgi:hypothetical protein